MAPAPIATPKVLQDPGYLFVAPLASAIPANTAENGVFTDAWPAAWIAFGATEAGSTINNSTTIEPVRVAEFFDPVKWATTDRTGSISFALANWTLSNYRRSQNGGVAALAASSGTGGTAVYNVRPVAPGSEVRAMIGWESLDSTIRFIAYQTIQGGEVSSAMTRAPGYATIPCTYNFEVPTSGIPWDIWGTESRA